MARLFKREGCKNWFMSFTEHGVQRCEATHTTNRRLAQRILDVRLGAIAEGRQPFPLVKSNAPRLKAWTDQFLETVPHAKTKHRYRASVRKLIAYLGENTRLSEIPASRIEGFKQARLKKGVSPASVNRDLATARLFLKQAARQRFIAKSPFADEGIDSLEERKTRRRPRIITYEEEARLLDAAPPQLRVLVLLLLETGMRIGREALPLKWADVDFANNQILIRESKTLAGRRNIPMSNLCKAELQEWKRLTGPDFSPFLFPNPDNPLQHLKAVRKSWAAALKKAKLEYFRIYDLRANFASRLSASGAPDNLVAGVIGHSTSSIVNTYAKVVDEYRRDAIEKLEAYRNQQQEKAASASEASNTTVRAESIPRI